MTTLSEYNFSAESGIKDSLFSQMAAVYASLREKNTTKEEVSFDEIANDVFGRGSDAKKIASSNNQSLSPHTLGSSEKKQNGGAHIK
ncbi:MAG: hypothetical protein FWD19_00020 [Defluviitaleaceae bacterium]|nr:hypothetical protein [Defluviitaleaceae bacterium]